MNLTFQQAAKLFDQSRLNELSQTEDGYRFLLLRSMSRAELLKGLAKELGISCTKSGKLLLQTLFDANCSTEQIQRFIQSVYSVERTKRQATEDRLINELYQINDFDWGGLYQNNLERNIVDNYVKKIPEYNLICKAIDEKLFPSLRAYTLCSWYNHWTSIIIEDIFRDHPAVIPAVGLIKQVDFFIGHTPYDLKVTRFPEEYIKIARTQQKLKPELTLLKKMCRECSIPIPKGLPAGKMLEDLWKKVDDQPTPSAQKLVHDLHDFRMKLLKETQDNPLPLINWYYENQGERRFDASNRIFLILIDSHNFFNSWQLKRARDLIRQSVDNSLSKIDKKGSRAVKFNWDNKTYTSQAEVIFVVK